MRINVELHCCGCRKVFVGWREDSKYQACCCTECLIKVKEAGKIVLNPDGSRTIYNPYKPKNDRFVFVGTKVKKRKKRNVYRDVHLKALAFAGVKDEEYDYDD